jgi:TM2 domain-containing membrane protein YozV
MNIYSWIILGLIFVAMGGITWIWCELEKEESFHFLDDSIFDCSNNADSDDLKK